MNDFRASLGCLGLPRIDKGEAEVTFDSSGFVWVPGAGNAGLVGRVTVMFGTSLGEATRLSVLSRANETVFRIEAREGRAEVVEV